jgi:hypothetical protein
MLRPIKQSRLLRSFGAIILAAAAADLLFFGIWSKFLFLLLG